MSAAQLPFYSTSYGENFGYNERDGTNSSTFRNRYMNAGYRGTTDLGPVRFSRSAGAGGESSTMNLAATRQLGAGTSSGSVMPNRDGSMFDSTRPFRPEAQTQGSLRDTPRALPQSYRQRNMSDQLYRHPSAAMVGPPVGVFVAPVASEDYDAAYTERAYQNSGAFSSRRAGESDRFHASAKLSASGGRVLEGTSVNASPYYIAPHASIPTNRLAPDAVSLGNRTYVFRTSDGEYPHPGSFSRTAPLELSSRPLADPGRNIPYGRLDAADASSVRHEQALASWDSFHVNPANMALYGAAAPTQTSREKRDAMVHYNLDGFKTGQSQTQSVEQQLQRKATQQIQAGVPAQRVVDQMNRTRRLDADLPDTARSGKDYGKASISKRLVEGAELRYQIPGYMGFSRTQQFRHGSTFGKTTRQCIAGSVTGL